MSRAHVSFFVLSLLLLAELLACAQPPRVESPPAPTKPQLGELSAAASQTDKGPSQHNYTELYERLLFDRKDDRITVFEIGVAEGGSLAMWQSYFPNARIFAIDILDKSQFNNARVT